MAHKEPMIQKAASLKNGNDVHTYEVSYKNKQPNSVDALCVAVNS